MVPAETDNYIIPPKSYIKKRLIFGKSKEELWMHIHLYAESPYHLGLRFMFSTGVIKPEIFIYPISNSFKVLYNLEGYSSFDGDNLPIKLQIFPMDKKSPNLLRYPFDI